MKNEQLIEHLTKSYSGPVKPLALPEKRFLVWASVAFLLVIVQFLGTGDFRSGWGEQLLAYPRLGLEVLLGFAIWIAAALLAFRASVPDLNNERPASRLLVPLLGLVFLCLLAISLFAPAMPPTMAGKRHNCYLETILFGVVPAGILFRQVRRGFVLNPVLTSILVGTAAFLPSAVLMHVACMYEPVHVLKLHILPAVAATAVFAFASAKFIGPYK